MKNASGETISAYCILDSDYHTEDEIAERYKQADTHRIKLHIWARKEIENYLLIPAAIARLILKRMVDQGAAPSPGAVQNKIDEIANRMQDDVFDALSHEYLSRDRRGGVKRANQNARQRLDQAWDTRLGRLSVIPGKRVISQLSEWSQNSFGVPFGPVTLARMLEKREVPAEIRAVVKAIETRKSFPKGLHTRQRQA